MEKMQAAVFVEKGKIQLREVPKPQPGPGEALMKVTLTTICGTDVHILKGEYPVKPGLIVGHEPVGRSRLRGGCRDLPGLASLTVPRLAA
jgi:D-arabinose 1-dehydrogenase-like Zn-dependent alcohol dehydrogenase